MAEHVDRAMATRRRLGDARFFDLHYAALVADPIERMRELYAWAEQDLSPEVEARMTAWLAQNPRGRHGSYRYSLEQYGLSRGELAPGFDEYVTTYGVALDGEP
jgi:hypothetical protein